MKLLIVDDHPLVRKGINAILSLEDNIDEVIEASNTDEALKLLAISTPQIAVVDINLGKANGLEFIEKAKEENFNTSFIVLTSSSRKSDFERAQSLGVDGYVLKGAYTEDIIYALRVVLRGQKYYDPEIVQQSWNNKEEKTDLDELTLREKDVLFELGLGLSNAEIAKKLYISEHTVKKHISSMLSKMSFNHRTEAALYANKTATLIQHF